MWTDVQAGEQRIKVDDRGTGSPVLLLHSSGLSSQQWRRLKERLALTHRVLAPDFIGYGQSSPWAGPGDFHYEADLRVAEQVAALTTEPIHLVGHSYGGFIALRLAAEGRVPVASLSLFDPVAFGALQSAADREGLADLEAIDRDGSFFNPALAGTPEWSERFVDYWGGPGYWSHLAPVQQAAFLACGVKMFQEVRSITQDRTPHTAYARIQAPTLLISGGATPPAARRVAAILAGTLVNARLHIMEGIGHMGPLTNADEVNDLIARQIESVDGSRTASA